VSYGVRYKLWNPQTVIASSFPKIFKTTALTLLMCHNRRESPLYRLPKAVLLFVLNMMPWNWNGDLDASEKPKVIKKKPKYSQHEGRSYYHRIHNHYHNNDEDDDFEDDDDLEDEDDEDWIQEEDDLEEEEEDLSEYVEFGGISLPSSILQSELFQERPEIAAWLIQQILAEQSAEEDGVVNNTLSFAAAAAADNLSEGMEVEVMEDGQEENGDGAVPSSSSTSSSSASTSSSSASGGGGGGATGRDRWTKE